MTKTTQEINPDNSADRFTERLNKFLSNNTNFARRNIDEFIFQGRVTVNRKVVLEPGMQVNPDTDDIKLDGERVREKTNKMYVMLNKPVGYITTTSDEKARKKVTDLIKIRDRIFPVGRLDFETSGLLILTNDGNFANSVMHPSKKVEKTYIVKLSKPLDEKHLQMLRNGIFLDKKKTRPCKISYSYKAPKDTLTITITEGRNRQVRRMFEHFGYFVNKLHRAEYGHLKLGILKPGEWRKLLPEEIEKFINKQTQNKDERTKRIN